MSERAIMFGMCVGSLLVYCGSGCPGTRGEIQMRCASWHCRDGLCSFHGPVLAVWGTAMSPAVPACEEVAVTGAAFSSRCLPA